MELLIKKFCEDNNIINRKIAIALSGGPDSMSVLLALSNLYKPENLLAIIVNHKLRPDIDKEIALVSSELIKLNIPFKVISWEHGKITSNIQENAREFRYNAMTSYCQNNNIEYLFTGHNFDDQIETFLIRFSRGSGIDGLCAMEQISEYNGIKICRPFLDIRKIELEKYLKNKRQIFVLDPSNENENFLRVKIRKLFQTENELYQRIGLTISNLQRSRNFIENEVNKYLSKITFNKIMIQIPLEEICEAHEEIRLRIWNKIITKFSGDYKKQRLDSIKRLDNFILHSNGSYALAGIIFTKISNILFCQPEISKNILYIDQTGSYHFSTYQFYCAPDNQQISIKKLRQSDLAEIKKKMTELPFPARIILNMPGVFALEKLLAVPHIRYCSKYEYENSFQAIL